MAKKILTTIFLLGCATSLAAQWRTPWDYEGPRGAAHWSELDPEYAACNAGREQSPIDIRATDKSDLAPLDFEYRSSPLQHLIDNRHTIRVNYHDAPGTGSFLIADGRRYQLTQFHFHRPSEERIDGKAYEMVLHLMHQSADGKVAGVAVFLKAGRANPTVEQVFAPWPAAFDKEIAVPGVEVNPAGMLPRETSYYVYSGSVTAPPCTEGVTWYVLKTPVEVSAAQIATFAKHYPEDVRPVQPLNGRIVKESR
jgi:carbonic anhydrase